MELVVDTNALSAWLDGDPAIEKPLSFASGLLLSPMALGEYRFGLQASRERTTYESKLQELEQRFKVLAVDRATATLYASIRRYLKTNGTPIPWHDVWIAAQAKQHDVRILSNDAHFDYVDPDLRVGW
ncbi:MAG: PIN domain-containing protein [Chthoniobacterales bacterium]|nr:PIN domain-containing protein [Chthoniobacterales bacterium]